MVGVGEVVYDITVVVLVVVVVVASLPRHYVVFIGRYVIITTLRSVFIRLYVTATSSLRCR